MHKITSILFKVLFSTQCFILFSFSSLYGDKVTSSSMHSRVSTNSEFFLNLLDIGTDENITGPFTEEEFYCGFDTAYRATNSEAFETISSCLENHLLTTRTEAVWSFDNTLNDEDGGHNAVNSSGVSFDGDNIAGGSSVVFDGTGGVEYSNPPFMTQSFNELSMGFWIKPDDATPSARQVIYEEGGTDGGIIITLGVTGTVIIAVKTAGLTRERIADFQFPDDNDWHHIAFSYKEGIGIGYLNGEIQDVTDTGLDTISMHTSGSGFGDTFGENILERGFDRFRGKIDEAFYSYQYISGVNILQYVQCISGTSFASSSSCPSEAFQSAAGSWVDINLATGDPVLGNIINTVDLNAIGLNENNGLVYGILEDTNAIATITEVINSGTNYTFISHQVGPVIGLPNVKFNSGDFYDNHLYVKPSVLGNEMYAIDIDPSSSNYLSVTETITLNRNIQIADLVIEPSTGIMYTVSLDKMVYRVDLNTGTVTQLGLIDYPDGSGSIPPSFGAQFMDGDGFFYGINNNTGIIYRIDLNDLPPVAVPFSLSNETNINDGARCHSAPIPLDFGDAPAIYGTSLEDNGARHFINNYDNVNNASDLVIGTRIDDESNGISSVGTGDDTDGIDDEDGFISLAPINTSEDTEYILNLPVINTIGANANVYAWVDFDRNGVFEDNEEYTTVAVPNGATIAVLTWSFPGDISEGVTYARFRITSDNLVDGSPGDRDDRALDIASDGEVEDYELLISCIPSTPTASVTVPTTCAINTGTITVSAPLGAGFEYSIDGVVYQTSNVFAGLAPNTYPVTVRSTTDATCVSAVVPVTIAPAIAPPTPTALVTIPATCTVNTGSITVSAPLGTGLEYSVDGMNYQTSNMFAGLAPNTYPVTVRSTTDATCVSAVVPVTIAPAIAPPTPTALVTTPATCAVNTGGITVSAPLGAGFEYSIDGVVYQTSNMFTGLTPNTYPVTVRSTTDATCVSVVVPVTIAPAIAPPTPTALVTTPATCAVNTGTITISAPLGTGLEYSVDGVNYQASTVFAGLTPAIYLATVRDTSDTTCISAATSVTIDPAIALITPVASVTTDPTCAANTGEITVNTPTGVTFEYSTNGTTFQSSSIFSGLAPDTYIITVRNTTDTSCIASTSITINGAVAPITPIASVSIDPTCVVNTGEITISSPTGVGFEYSIDGIMFQSSPVFSGLAPNTYPVTVRDTADTSCISTATSITISDASTSGFMITCPPSITLECGDGIDVANTGTPIVDENCSNVIFTFNDGDLANGCSENTGTFIRTFTGTDELGNTEMCTQTITIEDTLPPIFTDTLPEDVFVSCNAIPEVITPTVVDNCSQVELIFTETEIGRECSSNYAIERIWTAIDTCGNETSYVQTLNIACPITVYNGISPDNNGSNDIFLLEGIDCYPNNNVQIFNRWGILVFEKDHYDNKNNVFKGISEGRLTIAQNEKLPTGTYFYIINYEYTGTEGTSETLKQSGHLYISNSD